MTRIACPTIYPEVTTHYADGRIETGRDVPCRGRLIACPVCGAARWCTSEAQCLDGATGAHTVRRHFDIDDIYRDALGAPLVGWTRGERWNGWACPRFELAEAHQIAAANNAVAGEWRFTFDAATATFTLHDATNPDDPEHFAPEPLETAEGLRTVYAIGAWAWCWDEIEEAAR